MRQYASDRVKVAWSFTGPSPGLVAALAGAPGAVSALGGAIDITPGLASGTFIQPTRNRATWAQKPDGMGNTLRLFNPDNSGSMVLLIDSESAQHQILMSFANQDRIAQAFVGPLVIVDGNTREIAFYNKAYIATTPDVPKGVAGTIIPWRFNFQGVTQQPFGFNSNVVGD